MKRDGGAAVTFHGLKLKSVGSISLERWQKVDYRLYYNLESYLLDIVGPRFERQGYLDAFDFFCIVRWKANRAKSKIAEKLRKLAKEQDLEAAVRKLTIDLAGKPTPEERLRCLWETWQFYLPMATAVLTVFYPNDFTVYDVRVCDELEEFGNLGNTSKFENLWPRYQEYKRKVEESTPAELTLRDKDRYLFGKSIYDQLKKDIKQGFQHQAIRRD